ncbi:MAG: glycosyltransferase 87 family protein, partial [Longimicrobiales bacterium]
YAYIYPFLQLLVFVPIQWARTDQDRDTVAYYQAAERIDRGESVYDPRPPRGPHVVEAWYYLYPPFLAAAVSLATPMPFIAFARLWLLLLLAAFWFYAVCLCKLARGRVTFHGTLVAGAFLGLTPGIMQALNIGQADVLVWPMIAAALAFPAVRGAGFAAAALAKVHGIWPLAAAFARERMRVLGSAAAVVAIAVAIGTVALGPRGLVRSSTEWLRFVAPSLGQGQFEPGDPSLELRLPFDLGRVELPILVPTNLSVSFAPIAIARRAGWWEYRGGELPAPMRIYLAVIAIAAPIAAAWLFRRRTRPMHYALIVCAATVFAPIFRLTNVPLLLIPIAIALGERHRAVAAQPVKTARSAHVHV